MLNHEFRTRGILTECRCQILNGQIHNLAGWAFRVGAAAKYKVAAIKKMTVWTDQMPDLRIYVVIAV